MPGHLLLLLLAMAAAAPAERHTLASTPKTIHWGYYDAKQPPVLRVRSGDSVEIRTAMIDTPEALERAGVAANQIDAPSREIHREIKEHGLANLFHHYHNYQSSLDVAASAAAYRL